MTARRDAWLSNIFGQDVYHVRLACGEGGEEPMVVPPGFAYAKVPVSEVALASRLAQAGFRVVDAALTFERQPSPSLPVTHTATAIDVGSEGPPEALLRMAETAFSYSRFHLDPEVPNRIADAVKRAWVQSYHDGKRGERLLVARREGQPVGFLADLALTEGEARVRVIDLLGVDRALRRCGVGRSLVNHFIRTAAADRLRVGTQAANVPSVRLYEEAGFRLAGAQYVFHGHFSEETRI